MCWRAGGGRRVTDGAWRRLAVFLDEGEVARRLPVWSALSELFLDTELQPRDYRYIRDALAASGYPEAELRRILRAEVLPVFGGNMLSIAGEWAGWSDEGIREEVLAYLRGERPARAGRLVAWWLRDYLEREWARIADAG